MRFERYQQLHIQSTHTRSLIMLQFDMNNFQYKVIYSTTKKVIDMTYVYYKSTFSDKKLAILTTDGSIIVQSKLHRAHGRSLQISTRKKMKLSTNFLAFLPALPTAISVTECMSLTAMRTNRAVGCENTVYLYEHFDFSNPVHTYPCTSFVKACHFILNYLLFCTSSISSLSLLYCTSKHLYHLCQQYKHMQFHPL